MGVFNSLIINCPHCNVELSEEFKPGSMRCYRFPKDIKDTPLDYLQYINGKVWTCYNCGKKIKTLLDVDIKISNPRISEYLED